MNAHDVLSPGAGIPELRWALRGAAPKRALQGAVRELLEDGAVLRACRLRRVKFKPGRKLTVHYDAWIRSNGSQVVRPIVAVWDRGAGGAHREPHAGVEADAVSGGLAAPFHRLLGRLPEWNVSVLVSPLDPRCPQLVRLCDPAHVAAMLAGRGPEAYGKGYRVSAVRYRPGERHVLRYEPTAAPRAPAVFAKLSKRDADAARAFRLATRVADWLEGATGATRAVRPLAWIERDGAILFPEVTGRPLSELIRLRDGRAIGPLGEAGRALRALHSAPASLAEALARRDFATDSESVRRASEHIFALRPRTGAAIAETLERARTLYERLPAEPDAFTHGDFKADHLWASRRGLTLLDFGSCALGDPALDVGKFLADVKWWSPRQGRVAVRARDAFRAGYAGDGNRARLERARAYEALFLVMFAAHRIPLHHPEWASLTARQVERARAALDARP